MKVVTLTDEEIEILEAVEKGEFVSVKNLDKAKKDAIDAARNTMNKTKNINIRLSEKDLQKIKEKAIKDGLPYQTMISSIIHRFANQ